MRSLAVALAWVMGSATVLAPAAFAQDAPVERPAAQPDRSTDRPVERPADTPAAPPAEGKPADLVPSGAPSIEADSPALRASAVADDRVSLDEIRRFVSVFRAVKQAYVDPIDDVTLMRAAIRGLLIDLDPHSAYLDREASQTLNEQSSGAYDGLGVEVLQQPDRSLLVISPIDDTPAARAGI